MQSQGCPLSNEVHFALGGEGCKVAGAAPGGRPASAHVVTGNPDQHSCVCACARTHTSACAREPGRCCWDWRGHSPVQLSPQRGRWDDGYDGFAPDVF